MSLFIFDMDGTLVYRGPNDPEGWVRFPEQQTPMPLVVETCEALRAAGHTLAVASNQGGVAMGMLTEEEARALVENAARMIGAEFYELCPYHPEGLLPEYTKDADCRKPKPGMLLEILRKAGADLEDTLFVGDRPEDYGAAEAAGVEFAWSQDFFR
jgi:D-glycero-D-manno-heptose 1,7-bisphosphate phosphatase